MPIPRGKQALSKGFEVVQVDRGLCGRHAGSGAQRRPHLRAREEPPHEAAPDYVYTATIDCGRGPVEVVSEEDLWAPLVDLKRHRQYLPIAWDVEVQGHPVVQEEKPGVPRILKRFAMKCSYTDGVATGTVTVLGPLPMRR